MIRVVGLDLSIQSTGCASITVHDHGLIQASIKRIKSAKATDVPAGEQPTLEQRLDRLQGLEARITNAVLVPIDERPDLVVVEAPAYGASHFTQHDLSGFWHRVVRFVHLAGIPVAEVTPQRVKLYATGSGATNGANKVTKRHVIDAIRGNYPSTIAAEVANQTDRADALILAAIGCRRLGHPLEVSPLTAKQVGVVHDIRWPAGLPETPNQQGELTL